MQISAALRSPRETQNKKNAAIHGMEFVEHQLQKLQH